MDTKGCCLCMTEESKSWHKLKKYYWACNPCYRNACRDAKRETRYEDDEFRRRENWLAEIDYLIKEADTIHAYLAHQARLKDGFCGICMIEKAIYWHKLPENNWACPSCYRDIERDAKKDMGQVVIPGGHDKVMEDYFWDLGIRYAIRVANANWEDWKRQNQ